MADHRAQGRMRDLKSYVRELRHVLFYNSTLFNVKIEEELFNKKMKK